MIERAETLIRELAHDLQPVRRLPGLARVAAIIAGVALALVAAQLGFAWFAGAPLLKPAFASIDAYTIGAHALLAAGTLAFALGACVPGRERLTRLGALVLAIALIAIVWIGHERFAAWPGLAQLAPDWLDATIACSLGAIVPAALPALLLARFAASAAPRRVALVLLIGAAAPIGLLTQPGVLGCAYPDEMHHLIGHLLTPALGALILLAAMAPAFMASRRSKRA